MTRSELIQYMSMIVDMEKHCYIQKKVINKLLLIEDGLGRKNYFDKPREPIKQKIEIYFDLNFGEACMIALKAFVPVGFLILAILYYFIEDREWLNSITWKLFIYVGLFLFFACFIKMTIDDIAVDVRKNNDAKKMYAEALLQYNNCVENDNRRVEKELAQKPFLKREIQILTDKNNQSKQLLEELYSLNIRYSKYRNFVAASSILEYLESGRCDTLEGRDGAYNIFEEEIRLDRIILKLDDAINQLSRISNTQVLLYNEVSDSNRILDGLIDATNSMVNDISSLNANVSDMSYSIEQNTNNSAIAAYNTKRTADEIRYRNIKDNIYWGM